MRALDLFCGPGGVGWGLTIAGYQVTGVDTNDYSKTYPGEFIRADAYTFPLNGFDFVWASPPCQPFSMAHAGRRKHIPIDMEKLERLIERMNAAGVEWCVENVPQAPIRRDLLLCGQMFNLRLIRHRIFQLSFACPQPVHPKHSVSVRAGQAVSIAGHGGDGQSNVASWRYALGLESGMCEGLTRNEIAEMLPPSYSLFIGTQARKLLVARCNY